MKLSVWIVSCEGGLGAWKETCMWREGVKFVCATVLVVEVSISSPTKFWCLDFGSMLCGKLESWMWALSGSIVLVVTGPQGARARHDQEDWIAKQDIPLVVFHGTSHFPTWWINAISRGLLHCLWSFTNEEEGSFAGYLSLPFDLWSHSINSARKKSILNALFFMLSIDSWPCERLKVG